MEINKFLMRVGCCRALRFEIFQLRDSLTKRLDDSLGRNPDLSVHSRHASASPLTPLDNSRAVWQAANSSASLKWETPMRLASERR
jgi:hypothetical protein